MDDQTCAVQHVTSEGLSKEEVSWKPPFLSDPHALLTFSLYGAAFLETLRIINIDFSSEMLSAVLSDRFHAAADLTAGWPESMVEDSHCGL